ncbi:hypothetical protein LOS20_05890 [Enterococcus faecium]|nr:hypothetical protein [Enterococcus faecium]
MSQSLLRINGVQKLASAVISLTKRKIGEAIFVWLFLLLDAGQLFSQPLIHGVPEVASSYFLKLITSGTSSFLFGRIMVIPFL